MGKRTLYAEKIQEHCHGFVFDKAGLQEQYEKKRLKGGKDDSQLDWGVLEINSTNIKEFAPSGPFPATDP